MPGDKRSALITKAVMKIRVARDARNFIKTEKKINASPQT